MSIILYELVGADPARPFSPHCWKTRMALAHKGLAFETSPVPFTEVPKIEDGFATIVPVIRDGERRIADSFVIAEYLDTAYPDRPTLFGGEGGRVLSRFVESWSQRTIHPFVSTSRALLAIHDSLAAPDRAYFRETREKVFGQPLEDVVVGDEARLEEFRKKLTPLRALLEKQMFLGGEAPLFADYIVFGAFQWLRVVTPWEVLAADDVVAAWFERCLDLHGGEGRKVSRAA
ncbi:glutathione S-transferase family protein [Aureimonas sp. SA4125]|uniref:glutathione S-transferase family protein n=1 Tax=Aureimonas sp. SA4125 TaxID=2826993 RepID=UPI001CC3AA44|nr:glutathione S-transferase family protein [Aureimonas sp. SA4125]